MKRAVDGGSWALAISNIHVLEAAKHGDPEVLKKRMSFLQDAHEAGRIAWIASRDVIGDREMGHFVGNLLAPAERRAFVPTFGHLFANHHAVAERPHSGLAKSPAGFLEEAARSPAEIRGLLDEFNALLDRYRDKLVKERRMIETAHDLQVASFVEWVEGTEAGTTVVDFPLLISRLHDRSDAQHAQDLPVLWSTYRLERSLVEKQATFDHGHIRDILHALYARYVDRLSVDKSFLKRVRDSNLPWGDRVVANGDVLHDRVVW